MSSVRHFKHQTKNHLPLIPLLSTLIILLIAGGFFLPKTPQIEKQLGVTTKNLSVSGWETYKDKQYGYSLKHPKGWKVENKTSQGTRLISVNDDKKTAFVLIEGISGPSLKNKGEMEKVVKYLEEELTNKTNIKITNITRSIEKNIGGYLAEGEETYGDKTVVFEERFMVATNGRGLRMHAGYSPTAKDANKPITQAIMDSFNTK
ncbi:hypothetical protein HY404_03855 [Candidatus Microgenomates bacterium]|nr:hypothetical protein [Candidatus Microgenomates bacterium]